MPQYDITVEGEKPLRVEMDSPPSDDEVQEIYDRYIKSPLREGWFVGNDSKPHQTASSVDTHPEVETFGKQAKQAWEDVNKPLVTLGKDTTEQETAGMGKFGKSAIGTGEAAKHFTESLTSPLSLATVGLGGVLAKSYPWISRALSGAFGATMAKQTAEEAGELAGTPKNQRDAKTVAKHIASIALSGGTTMLAAYDAGLSKHPEVQANTKPTAATSKPSIPQQIINEAKGTLPLAASVAEKIEKSETSKNEPLPKPIEQPAEAPIVPPVEQPVKQPVANPVNPAPVETPVKPPEQPAANPPVLQTSAKNVTAPKPAPLVEVKPSPAPAPPSAQATEANPAPGPDVDIGEQFLSKHGVKIGDKVQLNLTKNGKNYAATILGYAGKDKAGNGLIEVNIKGKSKTVDPLKSNLRQNKGKAGNQTRNAILATLTPEEHDRVLTDESEFDSQVQGADEFLSNIDPTVYNTPKARGAAEQRAKMQARENAFRKLGIEGDHTNPVDVANALPKLMDYMSPKNVSTEFLNEEKPPVTPTLVSMPKLRPGEKQGDVFANQTEPISLKGKKGTDYERIQADKEKSEKDKSESEKGQTGFVGMGGAVPEEFNHPGDYVSNMFAAIDRDRAAMGKPPMEDTKRRTWDEDNQKALATMNRDPNWIPRLIDEVRDSPRALRSWEQAGMVWHRNRLMSEMHNAMSKINQAFEDGRAADLEEAKIDSARYEDELYDLDGVVGRNGTGSEAGRSLQAQKMAAGEDFSLVQMVLEKRAAKGGAKLTDAERAEIEKLHSDIETWQKKYDEHVAKSNEKEADLKLQLTTERLKKEATPIPPQFQRIIDRIGKTLDEQADAALLRIKARSGRLSAGLDPTVLADVSLVGARYIFKGMKKGVEWSSKLIEAIGEEYRPFLDQIWDAANKKYDEITDRTAGEKVKEVRRRIKDMSSPERIEYTTGKIADRIKRGKKDEISSLVQRLARSFVEQYPNINRDGLVDFVHNTLKKIDQKITRSQARDMISGYGDYKQLSQDKISVKLRDLKGQLQQVAKLESMQEGEPPLKTGIGRRTPSIEESKLIKQVNDAKREFQIPIDNPDTQLKSSLDTLKARLTSSIRDYEDRLANRDFDPAPKREIKMDNEALRLKAEAERAKSKFLSGLRADKMKNRKFNEKALDAMVKWSRGFLLSGPSTLGKLTSAAFLRLGLNPMEETVGSVLKHLPYVKQVAARAPIEGHGINARIEANALTAGLMQGLKDADQTLRTGKSSLDRVFGKRQDSGIGELDDEQKSVVDIFGHIHGALKAPVKRVAFERALLNQAEFYIGKGVDVSDPGVQTKMMVEAWKREAYKRANKDIFMQPNHYADRFRRAINSLEEKAKGEKNVKPTRKLAASMLRTLVPIMKVPTNIVGEAIEYATGLVTGSAKTAQAFHAGIDQLKPEQADQIMRELKKGTIGTAALLLGYYLPQYVGGFYQQGEKRPKGDVKYGGVRMFGHDIPKTILHHPLIEAAQMGATIARVADSKLRKKDLEKQGLPEGAFAGLLGLIDDVPFIEDTFEASKLMNPHDRGMYLGELAKSRIVPQMLSQAAEYYDKDAQGNPIKRKPDKTGLKAAGQYLEMGVPGLRETVPPRKRQ